MQAACEAERDDKVGVAVRDDPTERVVLDFLYHVAACVGNNAEATDLIVEEIDGETVIAAHGKGRAFVVFVGEFIGVVVAPVSGKAEEIEPLIGLGQLAVAILGDTASLFVVTEGVSAALVLLVGLEQAIIRGIFIECIYFPLWFHMLRKPLSSCM